MDANVIQFSTLKKTGKGSPQKETKINEPTFLETNKEMLELIKKHCEDFTSAVSEIGKAHQQDVGVQITFAFGQ